MIWKEYSARLREVLGLEGSPIAITYSMTPASGDKKGMFWACQALRDVPEKGYIINLSEENSTCLGGTSSLAG